MAAAGLTAEASRSTYHEPDSYQYSQRQDGSPELFSEDSGQHDEVTPPGEGGPYEYDDGSDEGFMDSYQNSGQYDEVAPPVEDGPYEYDEGSDEGSMDSYHEFHRRLQAFKERNGYSQSHNTDLFAQSANSPFKRWYKSYSYPYSGQNSQYQNNQSRRNRYCPQTGQSGDCPLRTQNRDSSPRRSRRSTSRVTWGGPDRGQNSQYQNNQRVQDPYSGQNSQYQNNQSRQNRYCPQTGQSGDCPLRTQTRSRRSRRSASRVAWDPNRRRTVNIDANDARFKRYEDDPKYMPYYPRVYHRYSK